MSDKTPQQNDNEEIDLGQLFNAIGRLFEKLFNFIGKIFKGIFTTIILILKPLVEHFKLIAIVLMAAAIIGYVVEKIKEPVYTSSMLVKPYFDSKYELANNIEYFNALISAENFRELSNVFEIDTLEAQKLIDFEIKIGPETQNDLLIEYDEYMKSIDSTLAQDVTYESFIENRDMLAGSIFSITARANSIDIFTHLEKGFIKTFENTHSIKMKERADSIYRVEKRDYLQQLQNVERLQETYIKIKESEANNGQVQLSGTLLPLTQEKADTKEFELFQEELKIRRQLKDLEERRVEEGDFYDILSSFERVGTKETEVINRLPLMYPIFIFALIVLVYAIMKAFRFIKKYEYNA